MASLTEIRKKPVNLNIEDDHLFVKEYEYNYSSPVLKNYKNVYYNSEGYLYKGFNVVKEPFRISSEYIINNRLRNFIKSIFLLQGKIKDKVLSIHDFWTYGYFDWHTDALVNLFFIQKNLNSTGHKLLLPASYKSYKYILDSLEPFGYNSQNIIFINDSKVYKCSDLTYCNTYTLNGNYNSALVRGVAETIKQRFGTLHAPDRLIYISRSKALKRKIGNEEEVENILISFGFEIVYPEELSYREQVVLFSSAKWLISIHGAGLTNMIFMNEGQNVLELREENDGSNNCYFSLASTMHLNYFYLKCKSTAKSNDHIGDLLADTVNMKGLLSKYLNAII